jgi:hypothetical protein
MSIVCVALRGFRDHMAMGAMATGLPERTTDSRPAALVAPPTTHSRCQWFDGSVRE